jgi:transposase
MLQITPQMKILVAVEPTDFRRGINGLARLCQESLQRDPFVGTVFVFPNRKATALKRLGVHLLAILLLAGDPTRTGAAVDWRPVGPSS